METYELTVTAIKILERKPFGPRYAWQQGEIDELYLNVRAEDAERHTVWFDAGGMERRVMSGGGAAVVCYDESNDWLLAPESYCVTANMPARPGSGKVEALVAPTQRITVRGKVKKSYPNGNYVLSHVKLVSK